MIKLIKKVFIFLLPFLLFLLSVYLIDPYDYFNKGKMNELKNKIAFISDYGRRLYFISYKKNPEPNAILGYSQAGVIKIPNIPEPGWCKLTFGGADTWEAIESFKVISANPGLKKVFIDINPFNYIVACSRVYNKASSRSYQAIQLLSNPSKYFYDKEVVWSSYMYLKSRILRDTSYVKLGNPEGTKDIFWEDQLKTARTSFKGDPEISRKELLKSLQEIKQYCDLHKIEIVIFSSMMHTELQDIARDFKIKVFLPDIIGIFGEIKDFAYPNEYTEIRQNFGDPFHVSSDSIYINALWKNDNTFCKIITKKNIDNVKN